MTKLYPFYRVFVPLLLGAAVSIACPAHTVRLDPDWGPLECVPFGGTLNVQGHLTRPSVDLKKRFVGEVLEGQRGRWVLSYTRHADLDEWVGREVVATGRLCSMSGGAVSVPHLQVDTLVLSVE